MTGKKGVLSIIAGIGIIALLLYFSNTKDIISVIKDIDPIWIILAILIYNINWILRGYRWQTILKYMNYKIGLTNSTSLTILGNFVNLITPAKIGDFARAFALKRNNNVDLSKGLSSIIVDRILDFLGVIILAYLSFMIISKSLSLPGWIKILVDNSIYILIIGFTVIGIVARFKYPLFQNIRFICKPKVMIELSVISIILWIFEISTMVVLFYSLNLDIDIPLVMSAIMIANLTKILPLTPGGIGAYEGTVAIVFVAGGLPYSLGLTLGILEHGIKNVYTILFGAFSLSYNGINIDNITKFKVVEFNNVKNNVG